MSQQTERPTITTFAIVQPSAFLEARVQEDSNYELDWLWAADQATNENERLYFLARALYINPNSAEAWRAVNALLKSRKSDSLTARLNAVLTTYKRTGHQAVKPA